MLIIRLYLVKDEISQQILDELRQMKKRQEEDKFLSKLDAMFTVLNSLMIFVFGIFLNNSLNQNPSLSLLLFGVASLIILASTLVGEFVAILRDDMNLRFDFWGILVLGVSAIISRIVGTYGIVSLDVQFAFVVWGIAMLFSILLVPFVLARLNTRYVAKFPTRCKAVKRRYFWQLFLISFVISVVIRVPDSLIYYFQGEWFPLFFSVAITLTMIVLLVIMFTRPFLQRSLIEEAMD
ncbi:hypothetical protein MUP77_15480 [Candidatus Bathyarchaeota archaeon]|nr:hypothetical protein [Candidatus Bathyarchaeota archaeon]